MCTILSVSRAFYEANREAVRERIMSDAVGNPDGAALLMIGTDGNNTTLLRAMNVDIILHTIDAQFGDDSAERLWLHQRWATTGYMGINGCHGFAAGDWTAMHNGVLMRKQADSFNVDSELIAYDLDAHGIEETIERLAAFEAYANCFLINNKTGAYYVVRLKHGELYTDGQGNFSTEKCGAICIAVKQGTRSDFAEPIVIPPKPIQRFRGHMSDWDIWEYGDDTFDELQEQIECLRYARTYEDLADMIEQEGWTHTGIPWAVWDEMSVDQLSWCARMDVWPASDKNGTHG